MAHRSHIRAEATLPGGRHLQLACHAQLVPAQGSQGPPSPCLPQSSLEVAGTAVVGPFS